MNLLLFNDTMSDGEVAVNPDQVRFVRRATDDKVTIVFDKDHSITVEGTLTDVVSHLKVGTRS